MAGRWTRAMSYIAMGAALAVLLAGPLTRSGILGWKAGLALFALASLAAGAAALWCLVGLVRGQRARIILLGAVAGSAGFAAFAAVLLHARGVPPIHDISTDTANPPKFTAITPEIRGSGSNSLEYDPANAPLQAAAYPMIQPVLLPMPVANAYRKVLDAVQAQGLDIVAAVPAEGRIEATDTARWWGFKDDVVIRIVADGQMSRVDIRSVSRVGRSDIGANAHRISAVVARLGRAAHRL